MSKKRTNEIPYTLQCSACGFTQMIWLPPEIVERLNRAAALYCYRRDCRDKRDESLPSILTISKNIEWRKDFGSLPNSWTIVEPRYISDEERTAEERTNALLQAGLDFLKNQPVKRKPYFTTWGKSDGSCGHIHESKTSAFRCLGNLFLPFCNQCRQFKHQIIYNADFLFI